MTVLEKSANTSPESEFHDRLIMVKMVLENFKSYAGRVEIGPFHKVFSPSFPSKFHSLIVLSYIFFDCCFFE